MGRRQTGQLRPPQYTGLYALLVLFAICDYRYGIRDWNGGAKGLYWATSGGKTLPEFRGLKSDSLQAGKKHYGIASAKKWTSPGKTAIGKHPEASGFYMAFPGYFQSHYFYYGYCIS